jgi:hypothetical protein
MGILDFHRLFRGEGHQNILPVVSVTVWDADRVGQHRQRD